MSVSISDYSGFLKNVYEILPKGAFLTTENNGKVNTMTIGWGGFGFKWGIPTAEVMVRESRFTKEALDKNLEFTLTFPLDSSMKEALSYCGKNSGRDTDKIADCNLTVIDSKELKTPVIACKSIVMECKVLSYMPMFENTTNSDILDKWYNSGDLHTVYLAEVVACYELNE